jgi:serine/threonine protein kinase
MPPFALSPGTALADRYRVDALLGHPGGFGIVYRAHDLHFDIDVAIKEFLPRALAGRVADGTAVLPHSDADADLFRHGLQQFLKEARTLARLDHPNIVRVQNYFEANGTAYLVMNYYEGRTLAEQLEREGGRLPPVVAVEIMIRVLDGLAAVHADDTLHRDVKPDNIYLTRGGRPILLDFGAARQAMGQKSQNLATVLSPGYAPVEQYGRQGLNQGPWTDVYACAATLYRMVTGTEPPYAPERVGAEDPLTAPRAVVPAIPPDLDAAIRRGMAMDRHERPASAREFSASIFPDEPPPQPEEPIFHAMGAWKMVVLSLCTFGVYEAYWFYRNWNRLAQRGAPHISPAWRTVFAVLWAYPMFKAVKGDAVENGVVVGWSAGFLAFFYFVSILAVRLPGAWWLISFASPLPFIPVQNTINAVAAGRGGTVDRRYSGLNVLVIIVGGLVLLLALIGTFIPA